MNSRVNTQTHTFTHIHTPIHTGQHTCTLTRTRTRTHYTQFCDKYRSLQPVVVLPFSRSHPPNDGSAEIEAHLHVPFEGVAAPLDHERRRKCQEDPRQDPRWRADLRGEANEGVPLWSVRGKLHDCLHLSRRGCK